MDNCVYNYSHFIHLSGKNGKKFVEKPVNCGEIQVIHITISKNVDNFFVKNTRCFKKPKKYVKNKKNSLKMWINIPYFTQHSKK